MLQLHSILRERPYCRCMKRGSTDVSIVGRYSIQSERRRELSKRLADPSPTSKCFDIPPPDALSTALKQNLHTFSFVSCPTPRSVLGRKRKREITYALYQYPTACPSETMDQRSNRAQLRCIFRFSPSHLALSRNHSTSKSNLLIRPFSAHAIRLCSPTSEIPRKVQFIRVSLPPRGQQGKLPAYSRNHKEPFDHETMEWHRGSRK